ncbi:DUF2752 domain-containing protein [Nocardioides albidus]|uniref:DUF2752 domain-containing protein n=1 Tax=Nocardioides albidus TaxID=1517589 RepID=A0A5C4VT33_9ACTN|nr:DUF2752 domain-containing protein [Nocardioides albidus]TNM38439.1 DUF2752 domain-containing protein [Nocardioides albidus]
MSTTHAPATRRPATSEVVAAAGVAGLGVACLLSPEHIEDGPVVCPFRRLTGLPCPGCGLTRSWVYAAHGWWREAFTAHLFGPLLAAVVLVLAVAVVRARVRRTAAPSLDRVVRHPVTIAVITAWLAFAIVRIAAAA